MKGVTYWCYLCKFKGTKKCSDTSESIECNRARFKPNFHVLYGLHHEKQRVTESRSEKTK